MPQQLVLHEADAFALYGVSDDAGGFTALKGNPARCVAAICWWSWPSISRAAQPKASHLARNGSELENFVDASQTLDLVVIDDDDQIIERVMRGKQRRFPGGPFVAFAVAQQGKHPVSLARRVFQPEPCRKRWSGHGRAIRWKLPLRERSGWRVPPMRPVLIKLIQPLLWEKILVPPRQHRGLRWHDLC